MHVQTLRSQRPVERLYVRVVGRLSWPREVDLNPVVICPKIRWLCSKLTFAGSTPPGDYLSNLGIPRTSVRICLTPHWLGIPPVSTFHSMPPSCASALLRVRSLIVSYEGGGQRPAPALRQVNLDIAAGEIVGILGESGSGKSTLALSILGLLPARASVEGSIFLEDEDLLGVAESRWAAIRGARMAMIFQEPGLALSPVMGVGDQIAEVIRAHRRMKKNPRRQEVNIVLRETGLSDVDRIYRAYPHQLSGGELHRVAIAQALVCRPDLVIADEPTRSLDVTLQAEVQNVLRDINRKFGSALIFITHNPALLAGFADRVLVMYAGRIVEQGPVAQVYRQPLHPYTKGLLQLVPGPLQHSGRRDRLPAIPGNLTDLDELGQGCAFEPRCFARTAVCQAESPGEIEPEADRRVSCFNHGN
jgi:oligopeptide/dipeptide ABC transporter ATP-binding protein